MGDISTVIGIHICGKICDGGVAEGDLDILKSSARSIVGLKSQGNDFTGQSDIRLLDQSLIAHLRASANAPGVVGIIVVPANYYLRAKGRKGNQQKKYSY